MRRNRTRGDDTGAALVLALIVVTVFGLIIAGALAFSDTSIRATVQLRDQAALNYAADGAAQAAVNNIRNSTFAGSSGQSCFGAGNTLNLPGFYGTKSAGVTCTPSPGSRVRIACTSLTNCNRPGAAILTLGNTAGEDGLYVKSLNSAGFHVRGVVMSNSNIKIAANALSTNTGVYARGGAGGCTGPITSDTSPFSAKTCQNSVGSALNVDPNYAPEITAVPVYRKVPACPSSGSITLQPGYYDDAAALTALTGGGSCTNKTWYFAPGNYYFDFHNSENPALSPTGGDVWTISNGNVVAGTPTPQGLLATPTIPGACVNPIDTATAVGVQFIFGNDSQLVIDKKVNAEFCGTYHGDRPPVVMYGLKAGNETVSAVLGLATNITGKIGDFTNVQNTKSTDGANASWSATVTGSKTTTTGTMTLAGFSPSTGSIPAGSVLKSATLRVVHSYSAGAAGTAGDTRTVVVTPKFGSATTVSLAPVVSGAVITESIPIPLATANSWSTQIHDGTFAGADLAYSATVGKTGIENVDSILLDLTYAAPAFRAQTGCISASPYVSNSSSICAFISTAQSPTTIFYVQGTTYAPLAALDVSFNNLTAQVFRFGVVARSLKIFETGSLSFTGPVIEVPDDSPGIGFGIYLSAFICEGAGPCPTTGSPNLTAFVTFVDPLAGVTAGQREVHVLSWSVPR